MSIFQRPVNFMSNCMWPIKKIIKNCTEDLTYISWSGYVS